ncbi:MAG: hypothetical protein N2593_01855 [Patescibacteria group bacterium]|nr:hypothetical protein [Patescibacteria group bacterium]
MQKNQISLAGEFAVLSQLVLHGYDANLTLGNTKNVDILVSDPKSKKLFKIEVKTSFATKPTKSKTFGYCFNWIMTIKNESIVDKNLYYCFVNIEKEKNKFRFFIVPSKIVAEYVNLQHQFWLENVFYKKGGIKEKDEKINIRTFRIGLDDNQNNYPIWTPLAKDFENNWKFK